MFSECPYQCLCDGPIGERLSNKGDKVQLLDYLCTELAAVRIVAHKKPQTLNNAMEVEMQVRGSFRDLSKTRPACLLDRQFPENRLFGQAKNSLKNFQS